jgi:hypothetical protein
METNNIDVIRQAVLFTKQNNLVYKKVYASGPPSKSFYAIKVVSIDPKTADWDSLEQDKDYFVTTFLTDGTEDWTAWKDALDNAKWFILSAAETRQKGTKNTSSITPVPNYNFRKEFLETEVSMEKPHLFGFKSPVYTSNVGAPVAEYKGVTPGSLERGYTANNNNMIQKAFNALSDQQKIVIGWSGGSFTEWWEDSYTSSIVKEEGDNPNVNNLSPEDNPAAVATFNQKIPLKKDYSEPEYSRFYFTKRKEFMKNPDPNKGEFTIPIPTDDEMILFGIPETFGVSFYQLGLLPTLNENDVDKKIIDQYVSKLMEQLKIRQTIDDIEDARKSALDQELNRAKNVKNKIDTGANIFTNLFRKVDN